MPNLRQNQHLPYTVHQLFDLVADVERYPQFLPWCRAVRITERYEDGFTADMVISFKHISEKYTSRVKLFPQKQEGGSARIEVTMLEGPFSHLINNWGFTPEEVGANVDFFIDFGFRSRLLGAMMGPLFGSAAEKMTDAFRTRAHALYGEPKLQS